MNKGLKQPFWKRHILHIAPLIRAIHDRIWKINKCKGEAWATWNAKAATLLIPTILVAETDSAHSTQGLRQPMQCYVLCPWHLISHFDNFMLVAGPLVLGKTESRCSAAHYTVRQIWSSTTTRRSPRWRLLKLADGSTYRTLTVVGRSPKNSTLIARCCAREHALSVGQSAYGTRLCIELTNNTLTCAVSDDSLSWTLGKGRKSWTWGPRLLWQFLIRHSAEL